MSEVKVNKISPRTACGTVTLGDSGDAFTIPSGVTITNNGTQVGFGRTGTVDWQTDSIKTTTFTAANGEGYFANTSGGAFTMNLPAGVVGNIVSVVDYTNTFATYNLTIAADGSEKIGGDTNDATLSTNGQSVTFVYVDGTEGWKNVQDSTSNVTGAAPYIVATGGTPCAGATCGDYKIHTFTGPGTFCVSQAGTPAGSTTVDYMVIAGGGSGTYDRGGGGGAGGYRESVPSPAAWTASPIADPGGALPVSATGYSIVVGGGAPGSTGGPNCGNKGSDSSFSSITSTGGGFGLYNKGSSPTEGPGGSGGGAGYSGGPNAGGVGNDPPVSPSQGFPGGTGSGSAGGAGGGGATVVGGNSVGPGGDGATSSINGTPTARAGGGGASSNGSPAAGGAGGGGTGGAPPTSDQGTAGTVNTGGGGGGSRCNTGGAGGSGVVIIRYKFQ